MWTVYEEAGVRALRDALAVSQPNMEDMLSALDLIATAKTHGNVSPGLRPAMERLGVGRVEEIAATILRPYPADFGA
jgi:hypothetical protein